MTLLTVDELREHVETALPDTAVQRLLDSTESDITNWCGPLNPDSYDEPSEVTEWHTLSHGTQIITLRQRATSVTEVNEYFVNSDHTDDIVPLLEDDEYWVDGNVLRRKLGWWNKRVQVIYTPESNLFRRKAAQILLVKLEINADPGTSFEGAGSWQHTTQDYEMQRQHILWALRAPPVFA